MRKTYEIRRTLRATKVKPTVKLRKNSHPSAATETLRDVFQHLEDSTAESYKTMASLIGSRTSWAVLTLILGASSSSAFAQPQAFLSRRAPDEEASSAISSAPARLTTDAIIAKVLDRNRVRGERLRRYSAVRTYQIKDSDGKLAAQAVVRVGYEAPDKKTFDKISEEGSAIVRHMVFDRLLQSEGESTSGPEQHDSAITTANYSFVMAGQEDIGPYHCFVFDTIPKRKDNYLFEGRIWVDAQDFAIVKIAGRPAKKPSSWISSAEFVREYQKIDGFWLPYRDETSVQVKMYGLKIFTVDHQQYAINSASPIQVESDHAGIQQ
jgi:hypothetical protein